MTSLRASIHTRLAEQGVTPEGAEAKFTLRASLPRDVDVSALGLDALGGSTLTVSPPNSREPTLRAADDPNAASARPATLHDVSDHVAVHGELARGGMGLVRLAEQRALDREVVVKSLLPHQRSRAAIQAILREARLAGRLEHPNTVPIYNLGWTEEDGPLIVMRRVRGTPWSALLDNAPVPQGELARHIAILENVCHAIEFAHSRGILHRDIKPDNVMVGDFGEVYVLDWGVAIPMEEIDEEADRIVGTPAYMAPEMVDPKRRVDARTDVFLLGATLFEIATGARLNDGEDVLEVLVNASSRETLTLPSDLPDALADIIQRACAPNPEHRYPAVRDFREALGHLLERRASTEATRVAQDELTHLHTLAQRDHDADHDILVNRSFSASRAGFEQALREWPQNPDAATGLRDALTTMIRYELRGRNARGANALLAELSDPPAELTDALTALRAELDEAERAEARLRELRSDMRFQGRDWGRSAVTLLNGLLVFTAVIIPAIHLRDTTPSHTHTLAFVAVGAIATILGMLPFRRFILDNALYGRVMLAFAGFAPVIAINHTAGLLLDAPFLTLLAGDGAVCTAFMVVLAATLARSFWISAIIAAIGTLTAVSTPRYALDIFAASYLLNNIYLAWVMRPGNDVLGPFFRADDA